MRAYAPGYFILRGTKFQRKFGRKHLDGYTDVKWWSGDTVQKSHSAEM